MRYHGILRVRRLSPYSGGRLFLRCRKHLRGAPIRAQTSEGCNPTRPIERGGVEHFSTFSDECILVALTASMMHSTDSSPNFLRDLGRAAGEQASGMADSGVSTAGVDHDVHKRSMTSGETPLETGIGSALLRGLATRFGALTAFFCHDSDAPQAAGRDRRTGNPASCNCFFHLRTVKVPK